MSDSFSRGEDKEKQRVCPSCRMQISVLATKCRYCGEEVGKPKEETRTLSIHDLGGESVHHRAPSGSVMEALESFRVEETLSSSDLPQLDPSSLDLSMGGGSAQSSGTSSTFGSSPRASTPAKRPANKIPLIAGIVGAVVVVAVLALAAPKLMGSFGGKEVDANVPTYVNRAPGILDDGGPAIEALQAAVEAIGHEDSGRNREVAEMAAQALHDEVHALLNKTPFEMENIREASSLASRGSQLYASAITKDLLDETSDDTRSYTMTLLRFDKDTDSAVFGLNDGSGKEASVRAGGTLAGRFKVDRVQAGLGKVILMDTKRGNRRVVFKSGSKAQAPD